MPITLDGTLGITTPALTVTGASIYTGGLTTAGNLTFSSTGQRITGDMSNATIANRLSFQSSTTNGNTNITAIPNGTSTTTQLNLEGDSAATNGSLAQFINVGGSEVRIASGIRGTGTYLPMTFYTGGSERMRIDTSGNVGIGTSTPTQKLHVAGAGSTYISVTSSNAGSGSGLYTANATNAYYIGAGAASGGSSLEFRDSTNSATRMVIDSSGNVGIGTSSPTHKLNVRGGRTVVQANNDLYSLQIEGASGAGQYYIGATNELSPSLVFSNVAGIERMRIDTNGNVGIGTNSPSAKLEINKGSAGSLVTFTDGVNTNFNFSTSSLIGTFGTDAGSTALALKSSGVERMRITSAGDVFVGGTTGAVLGYEKFSSYGTGSFRSASSYALGIWNTANTGLIACYTDSGGTFAGGLTASGASLTLFGGSSVNINSTGANPIVFNTNSSERMRIDASGNIGANVVPWTGVSNSFNYQVGVARFVANGNMNAGTWTNTSLVLTSNNGFIYSELVAIGNENGRNNGYKVYTILWNSFDGWQVSLKYSSQHGNDYGMVDVQMSGSTVQVKAQNNISGGAYRLFFTYYLY